MTRYTFPLRPDVLVSVELPEDLRSAEAERMGRWLAALPLPVEPPAADGWASWAVRAAPEAIPSALTEVHHYAYQVTARSAAGVVPRFKAA